METPRDRSRVTTDASGSFGYTYDGLERLTAGTTTNPESFTLDAGSNIASRTGPTATNTYDTSNRLTSDGTNTFTWSTADRLTGRGSDSFSYDPLDRLTGSTVASTARTYTYNGDGLLASRTQSSTTTNFLWDPSSSLSRLLQVGSDRLIYGLGPLFVVKADGSTLSFARDGGKSIRAEVNGSGTVTASFRYRAYGAIVQSTGASAPSYLGYAGQLLDPSGLYYMRARWYDPATGRFLMRDPLPGDPSAPTTTNAFLYGNANPAIKLDPTGLAASDYSSGCEDLGACKLAARSNWAYAVAYVFRDLDSTDPLTQVAALTKVSAVALAIAIPLGIAAAPAAVAASATAATLGGGTVAAATGTASQGLQRLESASEPIARLGEASDKFPGATSWEAVFRDSEGLNWGPHWIEQEGQILYGPSLRPWVTWTWGH